MKQQWALDPSKAATTSEELIEFLRILSGAREPSTFAAAQKVDLSGPHYQLSEEDFDIDVIAKKGKQRAIGSPTADATLRPIAPATNVDYAAIEAIYTHLVETMQLTQKQLCDAVKLRLYACFSLESPRRAAREAFAFLRESQRYTELDIGTLQMLINLARTGENHRMGAVLLRILRKRLTSGVFSLDDGSVSMAIADLAIFQMRSPLNMDRRRATVLLKRTILRDSAASAAVLASLPPVTIAALLDALVRSSSNAVESNDAQRLATLLDRDIMSRPAGSGDPDLPLCIAALTTERALARIATTLSTPQLRPLKSWLTRLASRGHLHDEAASAAVLAILLRSRSRRLDQCETEPEVTAFVQNTSERYLDLRASSSSWAWGLRVLLGMSSSLIRPSYSGRRRDRRSSSNSQPGAPPPPSLLQVHEANVLLETCMSPPHNIHPTPFLALPLLRNLMAQFPPQIERCMDVYRAMRRVDVRRGGWIGELLSHNRCADATSSSALSSAAGPDTATIQLLLDSLFACEPPEKEYIKEIITDLTTDSRMLNATRMLRANLRVRYTALVLGLINEDEAPRFAAAFFGDGGVQNSDQGASAWSSDWNASHWKTLIEHLSGLGELSTGGVRSTENVVASTMLPTPMSPPPSRRTWTDHLHTPLRVSLPLLMRVISSAVQSRQVTQGGHLFTAILHKFGHMATAAVASEKARVKGNIGGDFGVVHYGNPSATLPSSAAVLEAVGLLHDFIIEDRALEPDAALMTALMNAYNRCRSPREVYEIWDALAVASLTSHGNVVAKRADDAMGGSVFGEPNGPTTSTAGSPAPCSSHAVMNGAAVSCLLDTSGRYGPEARGRRAWRFAGRLDEDLIAAVKGRMGGISGNDRDEEESARSRSYLHARPHLLRSRNAWNSWLEFLCRRRCLAEALEELEAMKRQSELHGVKDDKHDGDASDPHVIRPDAKTVGMMLRFAARERDWQQARNEGGGGGQQNSTLATAWETLRARVKAGEFGSEIWEKVKDAGLREM